MRRKVAIGTSRSLATVACRRKTLRLFGNRKESLRVFAFHLRDASGFLESSSDSEPTTRYVVGKKSCLKNGCRSLLTACVSQRRYLYRTLRQFAIGILKLFLRWATRASLSLFESVALSLLNNDGTAEFRRRNKTPAEILADRVFRITKIFSSFANRKGCSVID